MRDGKWCQAVIGLGELETAVMQVMWETESALRVRDVMDLLTHTRPLAYTTVMTVLDNLHSKQMVTRELDGRAYRYRATRSREEQAVELLREVLRSSGNAEQVMLHFATSASAEESKILRRAARRTAPNKPIDPAS
ncbi:BlaI/MecI/CopY family transcriptional regulator [Rhodococcus erythropolis]|uniref:BlaI/MecI/CopY family transcriptional regulator n=1 Tax=Rhodococcus erythropolis TaxID=1833 RepID=UPI000AA090A7|nr:BlaI/MecI/CopY family transcriptional regulator [Rhodococcus erythropolis]MBT1258314.1 BlaI/MecI/CopY family transcriptional regulator [Rhodococcus erythropolis]